MPDSYLEIARSVLLIERRPLTAQSILNEALRRNTIPSHLFGATQQKTLQARLSEDISRYRGKSRFFRTGAGEFFLRELLSDPNVPDEFRQEYFAPRRRVELANDDVMAIPRNEWLGAFGDQSFVNASTFRTKFPKNSFEYQNISSIQETNDLLPVISFVLVHRNDCVLSYVFGKLKRGQDTMHKKRSIGFGGYVLEEHIDLTYDTYFGIVESGVSVLTDGVGLDSDLAESARYRAELVPRLWVLGRTHKNDEALYVVVDYQCPKNFDPGRPNLSVTGLKWIERYRLPNDFSSFDPLSERMLSNLQHDRFSAFVES